MTMQAKFPGTCSACGCRFSTGTPIEWERGRGARHATTAQCDVAKAHAAAAPKVTANLKGIHDFLMAAKGKGLLRPKARFLGPDAKELRLAVAGEHSKNPDAIYVKLSDSWIGTVLPSGEVQGQLADEPTLLATLQAISCCRGKGLRHTHVRL